MWTAKEQGPRNLWHVDLFYAACIPCLPKKSFAVIP